jgi:Na+-translocating ferredoxin:NAD+ oxidoreductase RnfC subunit
MNIYELAKQAGIEDAHFHAPHPGVISQLKSFAALVAAYEREECAKISDDVDGYDRFVNQLISKRIRARGTT